MTRNPVLPFSYDDAVQKVHMAENAWDAPDLALITTQV